MVRRLMIVLLVAGVIGIHPGIPGERTVRRGPEPDPFFTLRTTAKTHIILDWSRDRVRMAASGQRRMIVPGVPLGSGHAVDLEIEPFTVTGPGARFVLGRKGRPDEPIPFDPAGISFFRGQATGHPGSRVFLAFSERGATGRIELGPGKERFRILPGPDQSASVVPAGRASARPSSVPLCGVGPSDLPDVSAAKPTGPLQATTTIGPTRGLKNLELAVETDYEFFSLFGNTDDTLTYLMELYAEVSDIFIRDVDTRVELVFARVWDNPDDLFNVVDPSPLPEFQDYWNSNMGGVNRDAAQLVSGRRDYPFGGQAYLAALCNGSSYSVTGYMLGFFPDPSKPSVYSYDVEVTAHELGHNAGTGHTHDSPNFVDTCQDPNSTPQRGTIMSYCSQTWSGMNAVGDNYFHSRVQVNMDAYIASALCVIDDCNLNSVDDSLDITLGQSPDQNGNSIPDECEDCNGNMQIDQLDLALGTSFDVDGNGVPDECQPDCNDNDIPDATDIFVGTSMDAYGNKIPDECETDCNSNGISDYTEIQASMPLDLDRDTIIDACQDCDADGTIDLDALEGSHFAWVASGRPASDLRQFHPRTGVLTAVSTGGAGALVDEGQDLLILPGNRVLVSSRGDDRVMEFSVTGAYVGDLVAQGSGGLIAPTGLMTTPDQTTLLVSSEGTNSVLAYDAATGAFLGPFVSPGAGGLSGPFGLIFGPNGNLFVTSDTNEVMEYDGGTGAFVKVFVTAAGNGGLDEPRGILFKRDGHLLVASYGSNQVLEYDGQTGGALGRWALSGTTALDQVSPWGLRIAPNGHIFLSRTGTTFGSGGGTGHHEDEEHTEDEETAREGSLRKDHSESHLTNAQVYEFDVVNGNYLRPYIGGNDHGLLFATGFDFIDGWAIDCNVNYLPDTCDISLGFSDDLDASGIPDECEADCNGNGIQDRLDLIPAGPALDCNGNLTPDSCDIVAGLSNDCSSNGIPDECESDCNNNLIADSCELAAGTGMDCNGNGILDTCDVTDDLETGGMGWTAGDPGDTATTGLWTRVDPVGTGAQPEDDHTPGGGRFCFVTGQGLQGGGVGDNDVDGGYTTLVSPIYDLSAADEAEISYWRWFSNNAGSNPGEDIFRIEISNDGGGTWSPVETVGPLGPEASGGWNHHVFRVADILTPTAGVVLRFIAEDAGAGGSIVEAAIDDLFVLARSSLPPGEVQDLVVSQPAATSLDWSSLGGGTLYDVVSGNLSGLISAGGVTDAECVANGRTSPDWVDTRGDPAADQGYYYLVRAEQSCLAGSYGNASSGAGRFPVNDCP